MLIGRLSKYVPDIVAKYFPNLKYTTIDGVPKDIAEVVSMSSGARKTLNPDESTSLDDGLMKRVRLYGRPFYVAVPNENALQIDVRIYLRVEKYGDMDFVTIRGKGENIPSEAQHAWWLY